MSLSAVDGNCVCGLMSYDYPRAEESPIELVLLSLLLLLLVLLLLSYGVSSFLSSELRLSTLFLSAPLRCIGGSKLPVGLSTGESIMSSLLLCCFGSLRTGSASSTSSSFCTLRLTLLPFLVLMLMWAYNIDGSCPSTIFFLANIRSTFTF